jgi:hypothetical protein
MTDQSDYRLYLNSEFSRLNDKLDAIKDQTTKTNNRVTHLEEKVGCVDKEMEDYRVFKKYPKVFIFMVTILVVGILFSVYTTIDSFASKKREKEMLKMQEINQSYIRGNSYAPPLFKEKDTTPKVRYLDTVDLKRFGIE